jgi:surface antigen
MKQLNYFFIFTFFFSLSCQNQSDNKRIGQMIGGAVGAIVGSNYGSGNINALATILGATGGYLIGGQIAIILSKEEKEELNDVMQDSLENSEINEPSVWESDENENLKAEIIPIENFTLNNYSCRKYKQIVLIDNEKNINESKACRDSDGNWQILKN